MKPDRSLPGRARALVADVLQAIEQEGDLERALALSVWLARYLWVNFCGIYRLDDLESMLLKKLGPMPSSDAIETGGDELHVASAVYRTGGHTQLMKTLISAAPTPPDVLMTWPTTASEAAAILAVEAGRVSVPEAGLDVRTQLARWARKMAAYRHVVLHVHPDDVAGALAVHLARQLNPSMTVGFMNHADHAFSVAIGVADKVFEISAYGWALRASRGIESKASFVGIPIVPPQALPAGAGQGGFAFTGGTAHKYKPFRGRSLPAVLIKLLKQDAAIKLVVIGPRSKDHWWWRLRLIGGKRVQLMKPVPRERYLELINDCAFYIDSYPWPGGTAFPEALMRGCCVAALQGGSSGYSYADVLRDNSDEAFLDTCIKLSRRDAGLLRRQEEVRQGCIAFHAPAAVRGRMENAMRGALLELPPAEMLARPQEPAAELDWADHGRSVPPSLKQLRLDMEARRLILRLHARHFGWFCHATLKLWFDFRIKKRKEWA